ncbi:cytochrome P450, partial [Parafrankia sp. FMc6]
MELDDIDLLDLDRFMEGAPHEELAVLREYAPVWRHPEKEGPGFWVISKHADVVACSRDYQTFSSAAEHGGVVGMGEQTAEEKALVALEGEVMLYMDPPKHTRYRKLVSNAFTPQVTGLMDHKIRGIARSIVDD